MSTNPARASGQSTENRLKRVYLVLLDLYLSRQRSKPATASTISLVVQRDFGSTSLRLR